ncbi:MAG: hypothetical protein HQM15_09915 [Deltaproteobacteria bacterium]|nr:hypothetical protein [Deltaproteobacteria bacterium]
MKIKNGFGYLLGGFFIVASLGLSSLTWADPGPGHTPASAPSLGTLYYRTDSTTHLSTLAVKINSLGAGDHNGASCEYATVTPRILPPGYDTAWHPGGVFTYSYPESSYYCVTLSPVDLGLTDASQMKLRVKNSVSLITETTGAATLDNTPPTIGDSTATGDFHLTEASHAYIATRGSSSYTFVPRHITFAANVSDSGSGIVSCGYYLTSDRSSYPHYDGMILNPIPDPAGSGRIIGYTCLFDNVALPDNPALALSVMDQVGNTSTLNFGQILVVDDQAPSSSIQALPATTTTSTFNLTYNVNEVGDATHSGVDRIWIYYHYKANESAAWGPSHQYGDPITPTSNTGTVSLYRA